MSEPVPMMTSSAARDHRLVQLGAAGEVEPLHLEPVLLEDAGLGGDIRRAENTKAVGSGVPTRSLSSAWASVIQSARAADEGTSATRRMKSS